MKITHRFNESVLWEGEAASMQEALMLAKTQGANLRGADLVGANLRGATFNLAPRIFNIHRALYQAVTSPGHSLEMDRWQTCETTHCRAGWVIALSGEAGKTLEDWLGTPTAAALIYQVSDPALERVPDFLASNEDALADMQRLSELEASAL